jgi:hypothetical protein
MAHVLRATSTIVTIGAGISPCGVGLLSVSLAAGLRGLLHLGSPCLVMTRTVSRIRFRVLVDTVDTVDTEASGKRPPSITRERAHTISGFSISNESIVLGD